MSRKAFNDLGPRRRRQRLQLIRNADNENGIEREIEEPNLREGADDHPRPQ